MAAPPLEISAIRNLFVAALGSLPGWTLSTQPPDRFGFDPASILHKSFTVLCPSGDAVQPERQKATEGATQDSILEIRFAWLLRADAASADYSLSLAAEAAARGAVHAISRDKGLHLTYQGVSRTGSPAGDYLLTTLRYTARHLAALQ